MHQGIQSAPAGPRSFSAIVLGFILQHTPTGCILTADKLNPALDVPKTYRAAHGTRGALPAVNWWRGFRSDELSHFMEQASASKLDIAAAVARIVEADAQTRIVGAALLPTVSLTASLGLHSELLTQRPDIREAESRLADANLEAARAAFFRTSDGGWTSGW
jgi:outer membrane protein TolC